MDLGRFGEAIEDFNFVISYNPRVAGYYDNRQNAYRRSGRLDDALKDANKTIQLAPSYAFVFRGRANVYNDMGKYELAVSDYSTAIQLDSEDGGLFIDRGKILRTQKKFDDAISDFSHAIDLHGKWNSAYRERGLTYELLGRPEQAMSDLRAYNQLEPGDQDVIHALTELGNTTTIPPMPTPSPSIAATTPPNPEEAARRERERADHLEKAVAAAKKQLDDAAQFIKEDPHNPKLLDYVDRIAALNAAVGQGDPDDIERKMANLSAALANDKDYQQFAVALDQAAERGRGAASQRRNSACPGSARLPRRPRRQEPARAGSRHADAADQADRAGARKTEPGPTSAADRSNWQRHSRGQAR